VTGAGCWGPDRQQNAPANPLDISCKFGAVTNSSERTCTQHDEMSKGCQSGGINNLGYGPLRTVAPQCASMPSVNPLVGGSNPSRGATSPHNSQLSSAARREPARDRGHARAISLGVTRAMLSRISTAPLLSARIWMYAYREPLEPRPVFGLVCRQTSICGKRRNDSRHASSASVYRACRGSANERYAQ